MTAALSNYHSADSGLAMVQSPRHSNTGVHHEVATFGGSDQATDGGLPFLEILLGLRQFHDLGGGIAQSQQLAPTR
jgi:hypothetical protein